MSGFFCGFAFGGRLECLFPGRFCLFMAFAFSRLGGFLRRFFCGLSRPLLFSEALLFCELCGHTGLFFGELSLAGLQRGGFPRSGLCREALCLELAGFYLCGCIGVIW